MDYRNSIRKQALITVYLCNIILSVGCHRAKSSLCIVRQADETVPCFGSQVNTQTAQVKDANECCVEKQGRVLYTAIPGGKFECSVCQEILVEHGWLPSPPCDKHDCTHVPKKHLWFALSIANRRIQCLGRSYKDGLNCRRNQTLCSKPAQSSGPVFCFKHRLHKCNSSSCGCPASSMDWELARNVTECCLTRGRAGYAVHINEWYMEEAKLHKCLPCPENPSADTTWSQWSTCSSGSKCTRKRSMQIPYLENMPDYWCVETITMEESASDATNSQLVTVNENIHMIILALAVIGLSISFIFGGVLCIICIRKCKTQRSKSSATVINQNAEKPATKDVDQSSGGYLLPINGNASPVPNRNKARLELPKVQEHIYDELDYTTVVQRTADMPFSPTANVTYLELK